jgi:hypothetical protein
MTKVVINRCYGGFGLSDAAMTEYKLRAGVTDENWWVYDIARDDEHLVTIVEEMGQDVNNKFSKLHIVEIPDDVLWEIDEYDGMEWVAEQHRTWS